MSIERSRSKSIDGQWIRENETREFKYGYAVDGANSVAYQAAVKRLADFKIKNESMYKGMLEAEIRALENHGIFVPERKLEEDVNNRVMMLRMLDKINEPLSSENEKTDGAGFKTM